MDGKKVARLLNKEMDRKDFLKYSVGVVLAVIGVTGLLNSLVQEASSNRNSGGRYGSTPYG